jgi:hypothetical protein
MVTLPANTAIAVALASHSVTKSPADYPSLRGYGDFVENTQLEKNLLGIRGLEAVQVSSHRGPPTDRPPDKPPPWKGVSRGCLQERVDTRHISQLASFTRGSYCSSGNALLLAENAILGVKLKSQSSRQEKESTFVMENEHHQHLIWRTCQIQLSFKY